MNGTWLLTQILWDKQVNCNFVNKNFTNCKWQKALSGIFCKIVRMTWPESWHPSSSYLRYDVLSIQISCFSSFLLLHSFLFLNSCHPLINCTLALIPVLIVISASSLHHVDHAFKVLVESLAHFSFTQSMLFHSRPSRLSVSNFLPFSTSSPPATSLFCSF